MSLTPEQEGRIQERILNATEIQLGAYDTEEEKLAFVRWNFIAAVQGVVNVFGRDDAIQLLRDEQIALQSRPEDSPEAGVVS